MRGGWSRFVPVAAAFPAIAAAMALPGTLVGHKADHAVGVAAPPVVPRPVVHRTEPPPPPPPPATKPGKGLGDRNHTHTGPPGQNKDTSPPPAAAPPASPPPTSPPSPPPADPPDPSQPSAPAAHPDDHTPPGQSKDKNGNNGKGKGH